MPELLEARARAVLASMLDDIERTGDSDPVFQFLSRDPEPKALRIPPNMRHLMNNGPAKDEIFRYFRGLIAPAGINSCVFGSDMWCYRPTDATRSSHTPEELHKMANDWKLDVLLDLALFHRVEGLLVLAQDATDVVMLKQFYLRKPAFRLAGPSECDHGPQTSFRGRMKMFGDLRPENLCEHGGQV